MAELCICDFLRWCDELSLDYSHVPETGTDTEVVSNELVTIDQATSLDTHEPMVLHTPSSECVVVVAETPTNNEDLQRALPIQVVQSTTDEVDITAHAVEQPVSIDEQQPNEEAIKTCIQQIIANGWGCSEKVYYPPPHLSVLNNKDMMIIIGLTQRHGIELKGVLYTTPGEDRLRSAWKPYYHSVLNRMDINKILEVEQAVIQKSQLWDHQRSEATTALPAEVVIQMPEELQHFPTCFPSRQFTVERKQGTYSGILASCCDNKQCCLQDHYFTELVGTMMQTNSTFMNLYSFEEKEPPEMHQSISRCIAEYYVNRGMYKTKTFVGDGTTEVHDLCELCVGKYAVKE